MGSFSGKQEQGTQKKSPSQITHAGNHSSKKSEGLPTLEMQRTIGNHSFQQLLQTKLTISSTGDRYEREADRVAEQVMRVPKPQPMNANVCGDRCLQAQKSLQTARVGTNTPVQTTAPPIVGNVLRTPGRPLNSATRSFMESSFGQDFSSVRLHTDLQAGQSATELSARAYTVGSHIVFGPNQYAPATHHGRKLIAHELTHVIQQQNTATPVIQRQIPIGGPSPDSSDFVAERQYGNSGAPKATKCGRPAHCPKGFCDPYRSEKLAKYYRAKNAGLIMQGVSLMVSSRVVPLWWEYLNGGSAPKDLTAKFGNDFTKSPSTLKATRFLHNELKKAFQASPPNTPEFVTQSYNIKPWIPSAIAALDSPVSTNRMNFNVPKDIPGNLAGDIGKDQKSCKAGAKPSPFNDERHVSGYVGAVRLGKNIVLTPKINYTVKDTIDLCPGDCGTFLEQFATVPFSQYEATGISGDVPFIVKFPAPSLGSFTIPAPLSNSTGGFSPATTEPPMCIDTTETYEPPMCIDETDYSNQ